MQSLPRRVSSQAVHACWETLSDYRRNAARIAGRLPVLSLLPKNRDRSNSMGDLVSGALAAV